MLRLPRNLHIKRRCPADARAYIRPLGKQQAPSTVHMEVHKVLCLPRDLRTEVHKVLGLPRNLHMKVHKVLRLPRNLHIKRRCPADARAYIRPLGKQQAPHTAPHTVHMEVHKVLCLPRDLHTEVHKVLPLPRNLHMKVHKVLRLPRNLHIKRRCPADARAYIRPLGKQQAPHTVHMEVHKVLCLPRDLHTEFHKVLRLPRNLHMKVHKVLRLPRNLHIKRRCPADARAYIRPLGKSAGAHAADARAYIRPLGKQQAPHTVHMEVHLVLCLPRDLHTEVHKVLPLPRNLHMKVHKVLRLPRNLHIKRRCPVDARAYIRPLGKQQAPHTARKCYRQSAGAQPTPGRTSDPLASSKRRTQHANATGRAPVPSRRQGVHPTPWQAASTAHSAHGGS